MAKMKKTNYRQTIVHKTQHTQLQRATRTPLKAWGNNTNYFVSDNRKNFTICDMEACCLIPFKSIKSHHKNIEP